MKEEILKKFDELMETVSSKSNRFGDNYSRGVIGEIKKDLKRFRKFIDVKLSEVNK